MDLARRKRRKHCTSAEEYDISAHEDTKTSAIFFLGNKESALVYAPYLGKLNEHYNFQKTWKGVRESFLNAVWDLDELVSTKDLEMSFLTLSYKIILNMVGRKQLLPSCSVAEPWIKTWSVNLLSRIFCCSLIYFSSNVILVSPYCLILKDIDKGNADSWKWDFALMYSCENRWACTWFFLLLTFHLSPDRISDGVSESCTNPAASFSQSQANEQIWFQRKASSSVQ